MPARIPTGEQFPIGGTDEPAATAALRVAALERFRAETRSLEADWRTTRRERVFFMAVTGLGVLTTVVLALLGIGQSEPAHLLSPGAGLLLSGGGALRLRALTSRRD